MNRVLVVFSDGLLSELDSARHETPRSAWIRRAVEERLSKEAVAPLVPDDWVRGVWMGTAAEWAAFQEGAGFETPEETAILDRMHGITPEAVDWKALNQQQAEGLPADIQDEEGNPLSKPKARRKDVRKVPDQPVSVKNRGGRAPTTQEPSSKSVREGKSDTAAARAESPPSKSVKGSPAVRVRGAEKPGSGVRPKEPATAPGIISTESPSPKSLIRCHCSGVIIQAGPRKGQCTKCGNPKPKGETS